MRNPRNIGRPLAIGAPKPWIDIPARPSRMIHFFDPSNPRMAVKVPDIAKKVDIILANLEDAIDVKNKEAAREGLCKIARDTDFGTTQFWSRVNSLDSPWFLDDMMQIALGTSTTSINCSLSSKPSTSCSGRSSCMPFSKPPWAWPMWKRSPWPARACRA